MLNNMICGRLEDLPFDFRQHRVLPFNRQVTSADRAMNQITEVLNKMTPNLTDSQKQQLTDINQLLKSLPRPEPEPNSGIAMDKTTLITDLMNAITAIEQRAPVKEDENLLEKQLSALHEQQKKTVLEQKALRRRQDTQYEYSRLCALATSVVQENRLSYFGRLFGDWLKACEHHIKENGFDAVAKQLPPQELSPILLSSDSKQRRIATDYRSLCNEIEEGLRKPADPQAYFRADATSMFGGF